MVPELECVPIGEYLPAGLLEKMPGLGEGIFYGPETDFRLGMGSVAMIRVKVLSGEAQLSTPGLITPFFKPKTKVHHSTRAFWFVNDL